MISDLWASIKKTPFLFIFMFTQVIITCLILYIVIADYCWINEQNNSAQIAWGNKEYVKLFFKDNVPLQDIAPLTFSMPGMMASSEEEYQNNLLNFQKVEDFYNELNRLEYITVIPNQHNFTITLETEKAWNEDDKKYGTHNFFSDNGNSEYNILNTFFIGSNYLDYFNVKLSEGNVFTKEDYLYDGDFIPVIMGNSYRQYYSLNEEFNASLGPNMTQEKFKVIGFIAENQYYSPVNLTGVGNTVFSYDNQILIPYCERDLNDLLTDSYKRLMFFSRHVRTALSS